MLLEIGCDGVSGTENTETTMDRDTFYQTKLLQTPSNLTLSVLVRDLLQMALLMLGATARSTVGVMPFSPKYLTPDFQASTFPCYSSG